MKTILLALLLALTGFELSAQTPVVPPGRHSLPRYPQHAPAMHASSGPVANPQGEETVPPGYIDFQGVDVDQVLDVYAKLVNKTILRANLPGAKIILKTQTTLTRTEAIEALKAVLAMNNVSLIDMGDKFVKAVPSDQANGAGAEFNTQNVTNMPDLGSYVTRIVQLHYVKPSEMMQVLKPFSKLPDSIIAIDSNGILILRDYAENVKRMLEMIKRIDVSVPAEYISEVIPIRYAKVDDIAAALTSLGGGGGSTVTIGTAPSSSPISGIHNSPISGMNGGINTVGNSPFGRSSAQSYATSSRSAPSNRSSFADRLNKIINRASGGNSGGNDQIELFGQTKIIPDESSSSLLVFATRQDMAMIKSIISKLDVPLAQVLVEAVIMDVTIGNTFNFGVSAAQNPAANGNVIGGGGYNNGQPFANFLKSVTTNGVESIASSLATNGASSFASALPGGFNYFANIGPNFDLALQAAESDNHASIIQRPRIQTSQAKPAQFFVGNTVPYVTSTYNYGGAYGNQSSYSQLSVGVELDVTPYINPDGEVTMEIQQEIDDLNGYTDITGVGKVPNTIKRTLNTTITVRDRDTVMLGGFIKSDKSNNKSGVPFLSDIPLLGNLFTERSDQKDRQELIVLMRPTVLKTPALAAKNTIQEARRLPGISAAVAEDAQYENKLMEAERKRELKNAQSGVNTNGFYNMFLPEGDETTNSAPAATEENAAPADTNTDEQPVPENPKSMEMPQTPVPQNPAMPGTSKSNVQPALAKPPAISPAQKTKLDVLLNAYMAGKLTPEEYKADREKILSEGK